MQRALKTPRWAIALAAVLLGSAACGAGTGTEPAPAPRLPAPAAQSYDLGRDEGLGGHTLARHVGRSDRELAERLRRDRHIAAASSYTDRATAERVVSETLAGSKARVDAWLAREGPRPNLALDYRGEAGRPVGRVLERGGDRSRSTSDAVVVLRWSGPGAFFVLTSYPEVSR